MLRWTFQLTCRRSLIPTWPTAKLLACRSTLPRRSCGTTPISCVRRASKRGPETWQDMEEVIRTAQEKGIKGADGDRVCGFAYSGGLWQNVENWSSIHDQPYATLGNGRDGLGVELLYNTTEVVTHLKRMVRWLDEGLGRVRRREPRRFRHGRLHQLDLGQLPLLEHFLRGPPQRGERRRVQLGGQLLPARQRHHRRAAQLHHRWRRVLRHGRVFGGKSTRASPNSSAS